MEGKFLGRNIGKRREMPDPTKHSILSPAKFTSEIEVRDVDKTRKKGRGGHYRAPIEYTDENGEKFYKINKQGPKQMFIALMLKGIMNVSDVVVRHENGKWQYYSRLLSTPEEESFRQYMQFKNRMQ